MQGVWKKVQKIFKKIIKHLEDEAKDVNDDRPQSKKNSRPSSVILEPTIPMSLNSNTDRVKDTTVTKEAINDPKVAVETLWAMDKREKVNLNLQSKSTVFNKGDKASQDLFTSKSIDLSRPTYRTFVELLNNYTFETGIAEKHNTSHINEQSAFIRSVLATDIGKYLSTYLKSFKITDIERFLIDLWFTFQKRDVHQDSCPFEHVFVGEIRDGKVIGMHNWIQCCLEEAKGTFNYQGYIQNQYTSRYVGNIQFKWNSYLKQVSTIFFGSSPEFELALFTIVYMHVKGTDNVVQATFDNIPVKVVVHTFGKGKIGSAYPEIIR